jgi:hypothetical protein
VPYGLERPSAKGGVSSGGPAEMPKIPQRRFSAVDALISAHLPPSDIDARPLKAAAHVPHILR